MFGDFQLNTGIISPIRVHRAEQAVIGQLASATKVVFPCPGILSRFSEKRQCPRANCPAGL